MSEYCTECGKHNGTWLCKKHAIVDELLDVVRYYARTDRGDVAIEVLKKYGLEDEDFK
jgi:hypothetical protein